MFKKVKMVKKGYAGGIVSPVKYNLDLGRSKANRVDLGFNLDMGTAPKKKKAMKIAHLDLRRVIKKIKRQEGKKEGKEKKFDTSTYWGARAALKGSSARLSFKGLEGQPPGDMEKDIDPGKRQTRRKEGPTEPWVKGRGWWPRKMDVVPTQRAYRGIINIYEFPHSEGVGPSTTKKYISTKGREGGFTIRQEPPELGVVYEEGTAKKPSAPPREAAAPPTPRRPPRMKETIEAGKKTPKDIIKQKLKAFKPNLKTVDTARQSIGVVFGPRRIDMIDFTRENPEKYAPITPAEAWEIVSDIDRPGGPEALYWDVKNTAKTKSGGKFYRKAMR
jgi:hypothetical protein